MSVFDSKDFSYPQEQAVMRGVGRWVMLLKAIGLVDDENGEHRIHDWDHFNSKAKASWDRLAGAEIDPALDAAFGGALAASILPAWQATSVQPLEAMSPLAKMGALRHARLRVLQCRRNRSIKTRRAALERIGQDHSAGFVHSLTAD